MVSCFTNNAWVVTRSLHYAWQGWKLAGECERDGVGTITAVRHFVWGPDIAGQQSASLESGAEGVGGLLLIREWKPGRGMKQYMPLTDGLGSVCGLIDATDGSLAAEYDYDPYGGPVIERGIAADACPFRHRTRYYDSESWLYYYGYRYYDPSTTKWISKDPLGEAGGWNLTCFCNNDPVNGFDPLGLATEITAFEAEVINGVPMVRRRTMEWGFLQRGYAAEVPGSRTGWETAGADDMHWFYKSSDGSWETVGYGMAAGRNFGSNVRDQAKDFALFEAAMFTAGAGLAATPASIPTILKVAPGLLKGETARRVYKGAGATLAYQVVAETTEQEPTWGGYIGSFSGGFLGGYPGAFTYSYLSQKIDVYLGAQEEFNPKEFKIDLACGFGLNALGSGAKWIPANLRKIFEKPLKASQTLKHRNGAARRAVLKSLKEAEDYVKWNRIDPTVTGICDIFFPALGEGLDSKTGMEVEK